MSAIQDFIRTNIDNEMIVIPRGLCSSISVIDIAFIATSGAKFVLDDEYDHYVSNEENNDEYCNWEDTFRVRSEFDNYENICLLFAILNPGNHNRIYIKGISGGSLSKKYLKHAWDVAVEHNLTDTIFGDTIKKFGYKPKSDISPFLSNYLGVIEMKSARSDPGNL